MARKKGHHGKVVSQLEAPCIHGRTMTLYRYEDGSLVTAHHECPACDFARVERKDSGNSTNGEQRERGGIYD